MNLDNIPSSYYDTDALSASFPLPRDAIASYIERGNRGDILGPINREYGIMKGMKDRDHA